MMTEPAPPFQKFITRVHRRYVLMHVIEHGVMGLTIGAVTGILLTAMLIWRGLPAASVAIAMPILGLLLGLIHGLSSRPHRMQAATEADEQLRLADLLGSALAVSDTADWADVVRSQADAVCQRLSPSDVILHRLGVRVWGGAGLASALLCALALIPTSATTSLARQNDAGSVSAGDAEMMQSSALPRPTTIQSDPDSAERSRFGDDAVASRENSPATETDRSGDRPSLGKQPANGTGAASADASGAARLKLNTGKNPESAAHRSADGPGTESADGAGANSAGSSLAQSGVDQSTPPWRSSAWPAQIKQVQSDLQAGHIPDAYRDMIGGYFDSH